MFPFDTEIHGNHLLNYLPRNEWQAVARDLEFVQLRAGQLLSDAGRRIYHVYFPTTAVVTLLQSMEDGGCIEVAAVGRNGMTGVPVLTGGETMPTRVEVQRAGAAYRMSASALSQHFGRSEPLRRITLLYMQALLTEVAQTAACNRHHSVSKQLCRWLLIQYDRTRSNEMRVTHQFIADMLGVRREGITEAARKLHLAGVVHTSRARIELLDHASLQASACECYAIVKREFDRMLPSYRRAEPLV